MGPCFDVREGVGDEAVLVDDVSDPVGVASVRLVAGPVGKTDLAIHIAEQRKGEIELLREGRVFLDRVEGAAQDLDASLLELRVEVAEPATLGRSTRCVGLRVEPKDVRFSTELADRRVPVQVVLDEEIGSDVSHVQHHCPPIGLSKRSLPARSGLALFPAVRVD